MTVLTHSTFSLRPGRHRIADEAPPVPVVPGKPQLAPELIHTSAQLQPVRALEEAGRGITVDGVQLKFYVPPMPYDVDVSYVAGRMQDLLSEANVSDGIRTHVDALLGKLSTNPRDTLAYGELQLLQGHLSRTISDQQHRQQQGEMPLVGQNRHIAEQVLYELVDLGHSRDTEAIAVIQHALSVGQAAVEAETDALHTAEAQAGSVAAQYPFTH